RARAGGRAGGLQRVGLLQLRLGARHRGVLAPRRHAVVKSPPHSWGDRSSPFDGEVPAEGGGWGYMVKSPPHSWGGGAQRQRGIVKSPPHLWGGRAKRPGGKVKSPPHLWGGGPQGQRGSSEPCIALHPRDRTRDRRRGPGC